MTDRKNLRMIIRDAKTTLRLAKRPEIHDKIESNPQLEKKIYRVAGNIKRIRVEIKRLKA